MYATVYSVFMKNISTEVVRLQRECVTRCLPKGWQFRQFMHSMRHGEALEQCIEKNEDEITVFLDIDCIPLSQQSFTYLMDARWSALNGALIGAIQRANHISNKGHLYVGPFLMAFRNDIYKELGSPKFNETSRGDVGEELTYSWEDARKPVYFLYPSDVQRPLWNLVGDIEFGLGTTYEGLFYHAFGIRDGQTNKVFIDKCEEVLRGDAVPVTE